MAQVTIQLPPGMRDKADGRASLVVDASTVDAALAAAAERHPALGQAVFKAPGKPHRHVTVYLNDEDVRFLDDQLATAVAEGDEVMVSSPLAGG